MEAFTHFLFWKNPLQTLCFFSLAMSFLSLWVRKTAWLWGSFLFIAYILAIVSKTATILTLIPIGILFVCHYLLNKEIKYSTRYILFGITVAVSCALSFHFLPGFHNWQIASNITLSPISYPYNLWFNFDKPFIGIFALAFSIPLIQQREQWFRMLKTTLPLSIIGIIVLLGISLASGMVKWDPKVPIIFIPWVIANLFFVSIPEEAFFRGFIQRQLYYFFGTSPLASVGSVLTTSLLFTLMHVFWVNSFPFLCLIFLASIIYGTIYELTKAIEGSILCHFGLNLLHLLFFTYPALIKPL